MVSNANPVAGIEEIDLKMSLGGAVPAFRIVLYRSSSTRP
jgi:hypothetical protein